MSVNVVGDDWKDSASAFVIGRRYSLEVHEIDSNELEFTVSVLLPNGTWEAAAIALLQAEAQRRLLAGDWVLGGALFVAQERLDDYRQGGERVYVTRRSQAFHETPPERE